MTAARSPGLPARHCVVAAVLGCLALAPVLLGAGAAAPRMLLLDAAPAGEAIVAVGERGMILRSTDGAKSWTRSASPTRATLTAVAFASNRQPLRGWAVGHDALILATSDGGLTWARQFQGDNLEDSFLDVLAVDAERVFAVGAYALFAATADGGTTWTRRKITDTDFHFNRISRGPTGTLYLAGEHGTLLRSRDDGATWQPIPAPYEGSFYGILPLDERTLVAHGLRGRIFRSTDDGANWEQIRTPQPVLLATAARLANGAVLVGGHGRSLLISRDAGATFAPLPDALASAVAELVVLPAPAVLALGEAGATVIALPE